MTQLPSHESYPQFLHTTFHSITPVIVAYLKWGFQIQFPLDLTLQMQAK